MIDPVKSGLGSPITVRIFGADGGCPAERWIALQVHIQEVWLNFEYLFRFAIGHRGQQ
jgi:hypothetical protein